ncbi:hypothetical protein LCGC14_1440460 [marine sediment metagenome]|uniref:B box-type domain-containing protein n=1 Tax=marine sediment metagenome TaxID=412755 RepID=A0A0F9JKU1_9ZZZZ
MEKTIKSTVVVCDSCGERRLLFKCDYCGAAICRYCGCVVDYTQLETVRGHLLGFSYNKVMCQKHLPKESK